MRGRTPAVPAAAIVGEVRLLIARAARAPCPTLDHMAAAAGVNRDTIREALRQLREAGELQIRRSARSGGFKRKFRVIHGGEWSAWTAWTRREAYAAPVVEQRDHREAVMAAGRF